ncbi:MAG TPA: helix-turn-helix transcriptional regulator [Rugosimonospora sp.]
MPTPKDLPRDIGEFIRDLRRNARISLRQLADQAGVSNPYLSQIERGLRRPSAEVLQQIAGALRVSTPLMYLRAGLLDGKEGHNVLEAIAADPDLTAAQKQSLIQIYETFRRENAREAEASAAQAPASQVPAGEPGTGTGTGAGADAGTDSVVDDAPADPSGPGATAPADQADGPTATVPEQHPKPATNAARKAATTKEI